MMTPMDGDLDDVLVGEKPFYEMSDIQSTYDGEERMASLSLTPDPFESDSCRKAVSTDRRSLSGTRGEWERDPRADDDSIDGESTAELIQRVENQASRSSRHRRTICLFALAGLGMATLVVVSLASVIAVPRMQTFFAPHSQLHPEIKEALPRMKDDGPLLSNSSITRIALHEDRQRLSDFETEEKDVSVPPELWRIQHGDGQRISNLDTEVARTVADAVTVI